MGQASRLCEFGSLNDNRCRAAAIWKTSLDSFFCDKHKPNWLQCERIEAAPELTIDDLPTDLQRLGKPCAVNQPRRPLNRMPQNARRPWSRKWAVKPAGAGLP